MAPEMVIRITIALASRDWHLAGKVNCSAGAQLALPIQMTVHDGRQTFDGEIEYSTRDGSEGRAPRVTFGQTEEIDAKFACCGFRRSRGRNAHRSATGE